MNSKHVFLDSKKRGKVNRLVQTFSTCSFLAPVSPGRVPPADPKRAAPPDSPLLCSSKDSPSPLALFWQGHPDSLHSVAPLGHLPPPQRSSELSFGQLHQVSVLICLISPRSGPCSDFSTNVFHLSLSVLFKLGWHRCCWNRVATFGKCSETRLLPSFQPQNVRPPMDWLGSAALQSLHLALSVLCSIQTLCWGNTEEEEHCAISGTHLSLWEKAANHRFEWNRKKHNQDWSDTRHRVWNTETHHFSVLFLALFVGIKFDIIATQS